MSGFGLEGGTLSKRGEREKPEPLAVWGIESSPQEGRSGLLLPPVVAPGFGFVPSPASRTVVWLPLPPPTSTADPAPDGRKYQQSTLSSRFRIYIPTPADPLATSPPGPVSPLPAVPAAAPSGKILLRRRWRFLTAVSPCHAGSGRREQGGGAQGQGGSLPHRRRRQGPRLVQEDPPPPPEGPSGAFPVADAEAV